MSESIDKLGYLSIEAENGQAGLEKLKDYKIDAIVSVDTLPDVEGLELLRQIRSMGTTVPFLLVTNNLKSEASLDTLRLGAFDIFDRKKITEERFSKTVDDAVNLSLSQQQMTKNIDSLIPETDDMALKAQWREAAWYVMGLRALSSK